MMYTLLKPHCLLHKMDGLHQTVSRLNAQRFGKSGAVLNRFLVPVLWSTGYLYLANTRKVECKDTKEDVAKFQTRRDNMKL